MKRKHCSEEQIINILKEHEAGLLAEDVIRKHGIAHSTFPRWKSKFGGMEASDAKRLKGLEAQNNRLKKLLADTMLEKTAVEDALRRKW